jgi:TPP-dependent pyruvate/acetoin dehydrogenase alpha subunit
LLVEFSWANRVSTSAEQGFGVENALVGQEAFLVDAWDRIEDVVAARKAASRASTVRKPTFLTVVDHRPGGSATNVP